MAETLSNEQLAQKILELVGGPSNIVSATNCMTRLRLLVKNEKAVKNEEVKKVMGVLGLISEGTLIQVVLGPGKVKKVADEFNELLKLAESDVPSAVLDEENRKQKEVLNAKLSENKFVRFFQKIGIWFKTVKWKKGLRHIGNCFSPLIPGFIFFGICYSISVIINVCLGTDPSGSGALIDVIKYMDRLPSAGVVFFLIFRCIAIGFMDYLAIFVGINAAKEFGVTPVLGGAIGGLSICPSIINIAMKLGAQIHLGTYFEYIIKAGNGGVLAVILAVFLLGFLERHIRKHMPNVLDTVFTPLLTMLIGGVVFLFAIMPVTGILTSGITKGIQAMSSANLHVALRILLGFILGACFLPIISLGLHHGLTPFYTTLAQQPGGLVLYPIFAMNDACQVGVAASIWLKAKKAKHDRLQQNISGGIVPQILGISEPLIYGMTLPMATPYLPIAIGAGIGGAWINAWGVGFCSFDCSGLMGIPLCMYVNALGTQPRPGLAIGLYVAGWLIAVISGFFLAMFMVKPKHLERIPR